MYGIEEREDEVLMLRIDQYNKYEAYDGKERGVLLFSTWYTNRVVEMLLLWKELLCSYSLSFLDRKDRDSIL